MPTTSRRFFGPIALASALAFTAVGAAPAAAKHDQGDLDFGALIVDIMSGAVVDKSGTISLRAKYACRQYEAPYDGADILIASITGSAGGYDSLASITCDGTEQRITMSLEAFDGGATGPVTLQFGHEGITSDGTSGTIGVFVELSTKVVIAGD